MSGAFGVELDQEGGAPRNGIGALMKEAAESSLTPPPREDTARRCICEPGRHFPPEHERAGTLISDFQPAGLREIHFFVYKAPRVQYFVI